MKKANTKSPPLKPVPTPPNVEDLVQQSMDLIDQLGMPPLPRAAWVSMLEDIIRECSSRIELAKADDRRERG